MVIFTIDPKDHQDIHNAIRKIAVDKMLTLGFTDWEDITVVETSPFQVLVEIS